MAITVVYRMTHLLIWLLVDLAGVNMTYEPHEQVVAAASEYDWPVVDSLGVAWCESFHTATAWNQQTNDFGVWQINKHYWRDSGVFTRSQWDRKFTARGSAEMAYYVWKAGGWQLWACNPK